MPGLEAAPTQAPILSTPETQIFDTYCPARPTHSQLSDEELSIRYEIRKTIQEIRHRRWKRIALQFPDHMLPDAPRVYDLLQDRLRSSPRATNDEVKSDPMGDLEHEVKSMDLTKGTEGPTKEHACADPDGKLYILGDTSYGACCVDEIAAEHVLADAVVHYGRACLSPTVRLPVLHVFTVQSLDIPAVVSTLETVYPDKASKVLLVADVAYSSHVPSVASVLQIHGYTHIFATSIVRDPSSPIPNRTVPSDIFKATNATDDEASPLNDWHLFHISTPPSSLLLTLASRVASIHVYPTSSSASSLTSSANPTPLLRRRYALLTRVRTASIIGILINTLSASSTLPLLSHLRNLIAIAGKKSYTVVVGKVNAAKLANFAEVDAWVVVGCWESSLLEDEEGKGGTGWWKPCVTPWECEVGLGAEGGGSWRGRWQALGKLVGDDEGGRGRVDDASEGVDGQSVDGEEEFDDDRDAGPLQDEDESEPPDFDLRTGRYVSHSQPRRKAAVSSHKKGSSNRALTKRSKRDLAVINGEGSPGAAFLRENRTWTGLGTDFEIAYEDEKGAQIEKGRSGLARGYKEERESDKGLQ